jgi:DNA modification methylase
MTEHQDELLPNKISQLTSEEQAKRGEYRRRLAEYLKDPDFRAIEGFPIGSDEDILALSDPPYYTACPNPFLPEIITEWQQGREETRKKLGLKEDRYQREPFAADVSEGKYHPLYKLHPYPTKVPHQAIMRYILHYSNPDDIVFDGFCGTGMTGVAAQLCGDKKAVEGLGYQIDKDGMVWEGNKEISRLGTRKAVLNDLSTVATFIAHNYNTSLNTGTFEQEAKSILREVKQECSYMYETWHPNCDDPNRVKGTINYTAWSDVFMCPTCGYDIIFWDIAVNQEKGEIRDTWNCPACTTLLAKNPSRDSGALKAEKVWETRFDRELKQTIRQVKQVPIIINYRVGKKRFEKKPDISDQALILKIEETDIPFPIPTNPIPEGDKTSDTFNVGITHVNHYFTKRNLYALSKFVSLCNSSAFLFAATRVIGQINKMYRFTYQSGVWGAGGGPMSGTLYIPSLIKELNIINQIEQAISDQISTRNIGFNNDYLITTQTSTTLKIISDNCMDYMFIDPPFGSNLMYSELNFIREAWLKILTNNHSEAIINHSQNKNLVVYQTLIELSFKEFYRILKPGRWLTIEFHNSLNSVWNSIQEALQRAGFVIADVRTLDKEKGSYNQANASGAVKQDLIISAYKPNGNLEENFRLKAGTEDGAWEFVRYHLGKLPVVNQSNGTAIVNAERQAFLLYDRMVAFHIQRGVMVPISSPEFYAGLEQRFTRRDGMYFLPEQVAEYDHALLESGKPIQLSLLVSDEKTAINWLRQQLDTESGGEPQTRGDLTNQFNQTMHRAKHETALELIEILEQNFLEDEDGKWYVPDHNKASDLEKVRLHSLLKEFKEYAESSSRLRQFRTEAIRAGFADCLKRQDYVTIIKVAEHLPEDVLREDPDLLMYYDSALLRKK